MTEESADEDGDIVRQHKLVWRSEGTCLLAYRISSINTPGVLLFSRLKSMLYVLK